MQLTAITPYGNSGASSRVRVFDWLKHLGEPADVHCYLGCANNQPRTLARQPVSTFIVERGLHRLLDAPIRTLMLHREASPLSKGRLEGALLRRASLGVYDFDDALQWDHGHGGWSRRLAPKAEKCRQATVAADRVIAGNANLADWASRLSRDVVVIPSCVEPSSYDVVSDFSVHDPPRIGWIGSPSTEHHLALAAPALLRMHQRTGARLTVISSGDRFLGDLDAMVDRVNWRADTFTDQLRRLDVAIAPLVGSQYAEGKCAYKILQYGAAGLPCLGSPLGANAKALSTLGQAAATTSHEWDAHLERLLNASTTTRAALGRAGRTGVERHYSFTAWEGAMRTALGLGTSKARMPRSTTDGESRPLRIDVG